VSKFSFKLKKSTPAAAICSKGDAYDENYYTPSYNSIV